ncbi:MAG TPA: pyridoxamine 5-phosphate oxidase [Actinomycetota bacterium]|nr:pyridoxamine 5-phosphate oxidase [Actinomycetota bacterium]
MTAWREVELAHPDFARRVRERFDAHKHKVMATLRRDGSPRISGIEAEFARGEIRLGMMPGSFKVSDLKRDPRLALHSGTEDPNDQPGAVVDAKVSGLAIEKKRRPHPSFAIDVREVVLISVGDPPDHLVIETWHEGRGLRRTKRY